MNRLPSVKQLRYFVALEQREHFGKAAQACFVSPSAFSVAIRDLETLLGVQLVDRTNRQVTITAIGREVATQARLCLRDIEDLVELAAQRRAPLEGPLKLGVIPTIAPFLLPKLLPRVRKEHPALRLYIREGKTEQIYQDLMNGRLDLILIALPYALRNVQLMPLFRDRFLLACRRNTRLVDPEHFTLNRLTAGSVLLLEDGHCLRDHALAACRLRNLDTVNNFAASSLHTLLEMVDSDLGITFVPEMAVGSALLKHTRIQTYPLEKKSYREIGLAWRQSSARSPEFRKLGALIKAVA
jgi:LysR family hydrogen peroxide-inducible transcriptional activator